MKRGYINLSLPNVIVGGIMVVNVLLAILNDNVHSALGWSAAAVFILTRKD